MAVQFPSVHSFYVCLENTLVQLDEYKSTDLIVESDNAHETLKALKHFEQDVLSEQTAVCVLRKDCGDSGQILASLYQRDC